MIISITGHRADKIPNHEHVTSFLGFQYGFYQPERVIVGMANGTDLMAGALAIMHGIPVVAARPWAGHKPVKGDENTYQYIMDSALHAVNVNESQKFPGNWVYQKRNEWMVDHSDLVLAVWDGSASGTKNCYDYALAKDMEIVRFNPLTMEIERRVPVVPF